jgi:YHS domain-containing protein
VWIKGALEMKKNIGLQAASLICVTGLLGAAPALAESAINTGYFGDVAIMGYDTVAYFTDGQATKGSPEIAYQWMGATWHFATREHRDAFAAEPTRYAAQYGGYCSGAVAWGEAAANIDPEAWSIVDGRLYLIYSKPVHEQWEQNFEKLIDMADVRWPEVRAKLTPVADR